MNSTTNNTQKRIYVINGSDFGSTGSISWNIINYCQKNANMVFRFYVSNKKKDNDISFVLKEAQGLCKKINNIITKIDGSDGFRNKKSTLHIIEDIKRFNPDLIHFHTLHGYYINLPMILNYAQKQNIPIVWTLHDNWLFTGRCACIPVNCTEIEKKCLHCHFKNKYPFALFDFANKYYLKKEKMINDYKNICFVSPSLWNKSIGQSLLLKNSRVEVINNGIDLNIFKPTKSNIRKKLNLQNKFVILCVAYPWSNDKGLGVINELASRLNEKFQIIMVGLTDDIKTNKKILRHERINSQIELVKYYSMADVFLTPSVGDNFPTVDMESIACGTPVISFDVGGTKEIVTNEVGWIVNKGDIYALEKSINEAYEHPIPKSVCSSYAKRFDKNNMCKRYLDLYHEMINKSNN